MLRLKINCLQCLSAVGLHCSLLDWVFFTLNLVHVYLVFFVLPLLIKINIQHPINTYIKGEVHVVEEVDEFVYTYEQHAN